MNKLIHQSTQYGYGTLMALVRPMMFHNLYNGGEALVDLNELDWHVIGFIRFTKHLGIGKTREVHHGAHQCLLKAKEVRLVSS